MSEKIQDKHMGAPYVADVCSHLLRRPETAAEMTSLKAVHVTIASRTGEANPDNIRFAGEARFASEPVTQNARHLAFLHGQPPLSVSRGKVQESPDAAAVTGQSKLVSVYLEGGGSAELAELIAAYVLVEMVAMDPARATARQIAIEHLRSAGNRYAELLATPL